jgi:transcriptional regulator with XRE-family HTH domain
MNALRMAVESPDLQEQIRLAPGALIASRIKRARRDLGLSHDALGERMGGVTRQHLIKLEKAKHRPGAGMLTRLAEATGRPVEWFIDPDLDPSPFQDEEAA